MVSENVINVLVRRHVFESDRPFSAVLSGIFGGISEPDIDELDLDAALTLDPQAHHQARRRLVRLIAGNPVTMGEMTRQVPDAGSYAPVTVLIEQMPDGGTRVAYDTVESAIAPYDDAAASQVAQRLDAEVLDLIRQATGVPASATS